MSIGEDDLKKLIPSITAYIDAANYEPILRLAVMDFLTKSSTAVPWKAISQKFLELFPRTSLTFSTFSPEKTISRFALGTGERPADLKAYLALLLINEAVTESGEISNSSIRRLPGIREFLLPIIEYLKTQDSNYLRQRKVATLPDKALIEIADQLQVSSENARFNRFFFVDSKMAGDGSTEEISFYVLYRYSTKRREIVKTFLAILNPKRNGTRSFSFVHVYSVPDLRRELKRVARGPVLIYDRCVHFLGLSETVEGSDRDRAKIQGLKMIALPIGGVNRSHDHVAGVFLSHSLAGEPVVGRVAMVHIGYMTEIGNISDKDIKLEDLDNETEILNDLEMLNKKFRMVVKAEQKDIEIKKIYEYVIAAINNLPYIDRSHKFPQNTLRGITIETGGEPLD